MYSAAAGFDLFGLTEARFETLLLILVRVSVILTQVPIFSGTQVPTQVRFGLGLLITFIVAQTVPTLPVPLGLLELALAVLCQGFIGLVYGFVASLVFNGVQFAGAILDIQAGFGAVSVLNPTTNQQVTIIGEFEIALATLLYLVTDSHHQLLAGLSASFALVPLPWAGYDLFLEHSVLSFFAASLMIVLRIAAPVAIVLFLTTIALSLMSRVAPQMNVFSVGLPLSVLVGLIMILATFPLLGAVMPEIFSEAPRQFDTVLRHMGPVPIGTLGQ